MLPLKSKSFKHKYRGINKYVRCVRNLWPSFKHVNEWNIKKKELREKEKGK